ncbi:hypothetical protein OS187_06255 [Xanthomonadaceae bacterium JHOS43]|nr:hypothetical protein [Xanthomonadaceae bacterium JHOS43]MCX7563080.1 hypothetical protein [Xanthomonadaceae bacterium XH05]
MWDFNLSQVLGLLFRTLPFLLLRMAVYAGITLAYVIGIGGGGGVGWVIGRAGGAEAATGGAFWGALLGFGVISGVMFWVREYLLYLVKAGHIAVLVELLQGKAIPQGRGQIEHATSVVKARFVESSVLFGVDRLIAGILRAFNRMMLRIANFLPIPGLDGVAKFAGAVITLSLTYVDEVILAYNIRNRIENPWDGAREGLVLYAQNYKNLLKNALWLTLIVWALTLLIFLIVFAPVAALAAFVPSVGGFWTFAIAAIVAWGLKAALVDPLAMTALLQSYFKAIEGQTPNPEWAGKLESASGKFAQLGQKARDFAARPREPALQPAD